MKRFLIFNKTSNNLDYIIEVENLDISTVYTLKRSSSTNWTHPNEEVLVITDTENGFNISKKLDCEIDYSDFCEFVLLVSFINNNDPHLMSQYFAIEENNVIEL